MPLKETLLDIATKENSWLLRARLIAAYAAPFCLMPLLVKGTQEARCGYCLCLMFASWLLETVPTSMTSSLPFFLLPLLGLMAPDEVAVEYLNNTFLFILAVVLLALAVEGTNLYTRLSLTMLGKLGAGVKSVFTGIVAISFGTALVLHNAASTLVVFPVVEATLIEIENDALTNARRRRMLRRASVIARITSQPQDHSYESTRHSLGTPDQVSKHAGHDQSSTATPKFDPGSYGSQRRASVMSMDFAAKFQQESLKYQLIRRILLFSVVYTTTLGALCSMFGNPASYILLEHLQDRYARTGLDVLSWFVLCFPVSVAGIFTCWAIVFKHFLKEFDCEEDEETQENIAKILEDKYLTLGSISKGEVFILASLVVLCLLLVFRTSTLAPFGWQEFMGIDDARETTCVMAVVLLFFVIPHNPRVNPFGDLFLEWNVVNRKIPFNVLLTYGGGLCMARAIQKSGMAAWLSGLMMAMRSWNPIVVQVVLMVVTTLVTEVNNDAATASVLIPIACDLAESSRVNPLYYSFPVSVACSTGLLLPVASVPMALAHEALLGYEASKMFVPVVIIKSVTVLAIFVSVHTTGGYYYGFNIYPEWANKSSNNTNR